jgi:predicted dehydrogenase
MARRLRLGMIGGGPGSFIGSVHRMAARLDDQYTLVAGAFSSDPGRVQAIGEQAFLDPGRAYTDWREMVRAEAARADRPAVVAIVTPNDLHHAPAKACLEAGFHVICDKPMTTTWADARDLAATVARTGRLFALTHNYSAYPQVRLMREMVRGGELGALRLVQMDYAQEWAATAVEATGNRRAEWKTDPARAGAGGTLGDIGTHAYQLACFVTGQPAASLCAELTAFVPGRRLDDNAHILLRYDGGMRGGLWASQVAIGSKNAFSLQVIGDKGALVWQQEHPNQLLFTRLGESVRCLEREISGSRLPPGHPEGFIEAFGQLYNDFAEQIRAQLEGRAPKPEALLVPTVEEGCESVRFVLGAVKSSKLGGVWLPRADWTS